MDPEQVNQIAARHAVLVTIAMHMQHPGDDFERWHRGWAEINRLVDEINGLLMPRPGRRRDNASSGPYGIREAPWSAQALAARRSMTPFQLSSPTIRLTVVGWRWLRSSPDAFRRLTTPLDRRFRSLRAVVLLAALERHVHPPLPGHAVTGPLPQRAHRVPVRSHTECGPHPSG